MGRQVKLKNILCWGSGDLFGGGTQTVIGLWLFFFYTEVAGLSPAEAGLIFAIAKVWDGIIDPITGYLTDNIRTRWGRRRIFFVICGPMVLTFALLWVSGFSFLYYLVSYMVFCTVLALLMVPYDTLPSEMTSDYDVRSKMSGARMLFAQVGSFLAAFIPGQIINFVPNKEHAFVIVGITFAVLCSLPWIFVYKGTWERDNVPEPEKNGTLFKSIISLYKEMLSTFKLKTFRVHLCMYIGGSVGLDIFGALFIVYLLLILQVNPTMGSTAMSVMTFCQCLGIPLFTWLCMRVGNANAYKVAIAMIIASIAFYRFLNPSMTDLTLCIIGGAIVLGVARGGTYMIPWNVYVFLPDVDEALTGRRREGIYAGVMMLMRKISQAVAMMVVGFALEYFGYTKGMSNASPETIDGIKLVFLVGPALLGILALFGASRFKLNKHNHSILVTELNRMRQGGALHDASEETKKVVEELTGYPHHETWGMKVNNKPTLTSDTLA